MKWNEMKYLVPIMWLAALAKSLQGLLKKFQFSIAYIAPTLWLVVLATPPSLVLFKHFQSHFSRQLRDWRHSHHLLGLHVWSFNCIFRTSVVTIAEFPCSQSLVKARFSLHCDSTQAIVDIMRLSLFAIPWAAIFTHRILFLCDWVHLQCHE